MAAAQPTPQPQQFYNVREKRRAALELRKAGLSYDDIAKAVGYASGESARQAIRASLKQYEKESAQDIQRLQYAQLQQLVTVLWPKALAGDMAAVDRVLKIQERQASIFGTDAPQKTTGQVDVVHHRGLLIIDGQSEDDFVRQVENVKRELPAIIEAEGEEA